MTKEELDQIQTVCRAWLQEPGTGSESRLTIPAGGALARPVPLVSKALLTFDNVLITSAVDADTSVTYTGMIRRPGEPDEFFDTPLEKISAVSPLAPEAPPPAPLRPTQQRYQETIARLAEQQRDHSQEFDPSSPLPWRAERPAAAPETLPRYEVYTGTEMLGYTLLERVHAAGERSGSFYPSEDYFAYADVFAALPDAENEYLEESVKAAYELDNDLAETWPRFNELSDRVAALNLYLQTEEGRRVAAAEVRLVDLSTKYDDQTERWLYITENEQQPVTEESLP